MIVLQKLCTEFVLVGLSYSQISLSDAELRALYKLPTVMNLSEFENHIGDVPKGLF